MGMRLDKYLKVTHLIKRREQAKEYIQAGYAFVNGRPAKPATEIEVGDTITLGEENQPRMVVKVEKIRNSCPLDQVTTMYSVLKQND